MERVDSGAPLREIEGHTRVMAGPGAGKTHWLVVQLRNIVERSERLGPTARVACISYTNAAADTVQGRLGTCTDRVDVTTIHSFLYRQVVRPYLSWLKDEKGAPLVSGYRLVRGHDEHRPSKGEIERWVKDAGHGRLRRAWRGKRPERVINSMRSLRWSMNKDGSWALTPCDEWNLFSYITDAPLVDYKARYWERGIIDHEDVLYFAHRLLAENAGLLRFLSARFPYLIIDEFQDTTAIQTDIVRWLAAAGSTIYVIGDTSQSIFEFAGACSSDLKDFSLPGQRTLSIEMNRRSTDAIISLLNHIRSDEISQIGKRAVAGESVSLVVGPRDAVVSHVRGLLPLAAPPVLLTRKRADVAALAGAKKAPPWAILDKVDSRRSRWLQALARALEFAHHDIDMLDDSSVYKDQSPAFGRAIACLVRAMSRPDGGLRQPLKANAKGVFDKTAVRGLAVRLLKWLVADVGVWADFSVLEVYARIDEVLRELNPYVCLRGVRPNSKFHNEAEKIAFADLVGAADAQQVAGVRTIHKAKGHQYGSVLVWFADEAALGPVLWPQRDEHGRIVYVACSRAEDRLFLGVPKLRSDGTRQAERLGIKVVRLVK